MARQHDPSDPTDARNLHRFEQIMALSADMLPPAWWGVYAKCVKKGFTPGQALLLVQTWILSTGSATLIVSSLHQTGGESAPQKPEGDEAP